MDLIDRLCAAPGDAVAAIDDSGRSLVYSELIAAAAALLEVIGQQRKLILLEGGNTIDWLIAYVAGLMGRHPLFIAPAGGLAAMAQFEAAFAPPLRLVAANGYQPQETGSSEDAPLHPELAVLLSTSGSTGSVKCVRLSRSNLAANAASICTYLGIGPDERGVVSLPTHYSYGLSIVNSHLFAGSTLLLTGLSVIDSEFWSFCRHHAATSFAGVPHSYDLLQRIDLAQKAPASLRYFTQAGGRLPPETVTKFASLAAEHGWRFYVMYGQTEAAPRMAYLPPEQATQHPDCIGVAIPGGRFTIIDAQGEAVDEPGVEGELVYEGPNVMMGYATGPADLAGPPGPSLLRTGDLARRNTAGLVQITGRLSRFIKIFGARIGLDDVERLLLAEGHAAIATGIDDHLLVVTRDTGATAAIAALLRERLNLPAQYLSVRGVTDYPLLPSGKVDYASLRASIVPPSPERADAAPAGGRWRLGRARANPAAGVAEAFLSVFGDEARDENATFNSLGGDSLTYVTVAVSLERFLPQLPDDWEIQPIGALAEMANAQSDAGFRETSPGQPAGASVLTKIATVRGLACLLVVAFHVVGASPGEGLKLPAGSPWHHVMDSFKFFRMPLFTALAGYFYAAMPAIREGFPRFMRRRGRQLLVPLIFATLVFWSLRKLTYGLDGDLISAFVYGYQHIWYLYALLLIFAFVAFVDTYTNPSWRTWAATMVIVPIASAVTGDIEILQVSSAMFLLPFFVFGLLLYREPSLLRSPALLAGSVVAMSCILTLQQLQIYGVDLLPIVRPALSGRSWIFFWLCGCASVVVLLHLFPRIGWLEWIAPYSFAIYLWHPAANGVVRNALMSLGMHSIPVLFWTGLAAGVLLPIGAQVVMLRFPRLSLPVIGR